MRIVCPSCQAAYDVPSPVLEAGRTLRCARCGADFTPPVPDAPPGRAPALTEAAREPDRAPAPEQKVLPAPVPPAEPAPLSVERLVPLPGVAAAAVSQPRARPVVVAGWAVSLAVLVAMGWGFLAWRAAIERAWPASERLYSALRLT